MPVCCILDCGVTRPSSDPRQFTLFELPKDLDKRQKWLEAIIPHLRKIKAMKSKITKLFICELHFKAEDVVRDFETRLSGGTIHRFQRDRIKLKNASVIPCIFDKAQLNNALKSEIQKSPAHQIESAVDEVDLSGSTWANTENNEDPLQLRLINVSPKKLKNTAILSANLTPAPEAESQAEPSKRNVRMQKRKSKALLLDASLPIDVKVDDQAEVHSICPTTDVEKCVNCIALKAEIESLKKENLVLKEQINNKFQIWTSEKQFEDKIENAPGLVFNATNKSAL